MSNSGELVGRDRDIGMKAERIRRRIFIPLGLSLAVLLAASVIGAYWLQDRRIDNRVHSRIDEVHRMFQAELDRDAELMSGLIDFLEADEGLRKAWLAKDRDMLFNIASPIFENIRSKYRVTHFYLYDVDSTCFLRVHNPSRHGDRIERFTMKEAVQKGEGVHGIELGPFGTFTLRVVHPWRINGELVGYIELGEAIEHITPHVKGMLGTELFFFIDKSHLNRAKWEEGLKMMKRTGQWDMCDYFVMIDSTMETPPQELISYMKLVHSEHAEPVFSLSVGERKYHG